ncbi:MAG: aminotransferase class IV [Saprospiraceae bacterium]|nr:aminotransferase class IV [Saprospiraceae bacterium]
MENILLNGVVTPAQAFHISLSNRSFRYGDGVFESLRVSNRHPLFFRSHYSRFVRGLDALGIEVPGDFSFMHFYRCLMKIIEANNINNGHLRVTAFRNGAGKYTPEDNSFTWVVSTTSIEDNLTFFPLNQGGIELGIYEAHQKPMNVLSNLKTNNAIIPVLAAKYVFEQKLDDALILNTNGNIAETVSSNLFYYKAGKIYTPHLSEGGLEGIMRSVVKKLAIWNKIPLEEKAISVEELHGAEEIFTTNASKGIVWVEKFQETTYSNSFTKGLHLKLNERVAKILESR